MMRKLYFILFCIGLGLFSSYETAAQTSRPAVSAAEVTGTFRYGFTGKFKGSSNDIKIQALGKGKLKVSLLLLYPYIDSAGALSANTGGMDEIADISGDTAVINTNAFGGCTITIKFTKPGVIKVDQENSDFQCGFGHNVNASGTYRKVSSAKPKF